MNDLRQTSTVWGACLFITLGIACCEYAIADDIICCGGDEVFVIDPLNPSVKKWSWRAENSPSIPEDFRAKFRSTDDCKPYQGDSIHPDSSSNLIRRGKERSVHSKADRQAIEAIEWKLGLKTENQA